MASNTQDSCAARKRPIHRAARAGDTSALSSTARPLVSGSTRKRKRSAETVNLDELDSDEEQVDVTDSDSRQIDDDLQLLGQINTVVKISNHLPELDTEAPGMQMTPPLLPVSLHRLEPNTARHGEIIHVISMESDQRFGAMGQDVADALGRVFGERPFGDGRVEIKGYVRRLGRQAVKLHQRKVSEHLTKKELRLEELTIDYPGPERYNNPHARQSKFAHAADQAERPTKRIKADLPIPNVACRGSETPLDPISESLHVQVAFPAVRTTEAITPFDDNAILAQIITDRRTSQAMLLDSSPEPERSWNVKDFFDEIKDGKGRPLKLGHLMSPALDLAGIESQADLSLFDPKLWQTYLLEFPPAGLQERFVPLIEEHVENWLSELGRPVNTEASKGMNTFLNGLSNGLGSDEVVHLMAKLGFEDENSLIEYEEKHWLKLSARPVWQNDPLQAYKVDPAASDC